VFDVCTKLFAEQSSLMVHQCLFGECSGICDVYNKSFKVKSDLNVHQHIHT
jgi:hypothetical protein